MRIAYLASRQTLPGAPDRRADAFEHDRMIAALDPAISARGARLEAIAWDDPEADWRAFDAALIGSTWDYQDRLAEFLAALDRIAAATCLFNSTRLVAWNSHKSYLRDLEAAGAPTIPTLWLDRADPAALATAFEIFGADELVCKRQIGANAEGQHRLRRGEPPPAMTAPMMVQPLMPAIESEGELSFVFIGGALSHALRKTAAAGDYRIQSNYGGSTAPYSPPLAEITIALSILATLPETPLYARVDMVRDDEGGLRLMELELIEPYLYPEQGPEAGEHLASALLSACDTRPADQPPPIDASR